MQQNLVSNCILHCARKSCYTKITVKNILLQYAELVANSFICSRVLKNKSKISVFELVTLFWSKSIHVCSRVVHPAYSGNKIYRGALSKTALSIRFTLHQSTEISTTIRRKKSDYNSKSTSHAFVAGFVLAILVKKSYILSRDPFMIKK